MVLNGNHKGEKCLIKENHCLSSDENTADFWKKYEADLAECQETKVVHMGDVDFFVEIYVKNPQLIIFGGGHVSQPVAKIGKMLGFHVTVMDDREDFVTSERFPDADRLIKGSYDWSCGGCCQEKRKWNYDHDHIQEWFFSKRDRK